MKQKFKTPKKANDYCPGCNCWMWIGWGSYDEKGNFVCSDCGVKG